MLIRLTLALLLASFVQTAVAAPARIVILRHGEKADDWKLCEVGEQRAKALALNYLGKDAAKSLFAGGEDPAFFFAITLHTLELASPATETWSKPIILYSVVPETGQSKDEFEKELNKRTREAARNLLTNPALAGKTLVMVWEHKHIANEKLESKFDGEDVTLKQLFNLDILPGVPKTWPGDTYDYFWIVDFPANSNVPSKFSMVKQDFGTSFPEVPANDWDKPNGLDASSGCKVETDE
ncbi:MAG TPA: histidine phosphatase family protein [Methyloceanibacter sp.]|nr:histidine phosphatase family protein [Methyloceanibacter sp.]